MNNKIDKGNISLKIFLRAIREDDKELVQNCIAQGIDVNGRTKTGASPLHVCTYHGAVKSLPILLKAGANPFSLYIYNETILHVGSYEGNEDVIKSLLDYTLKNYGLEKTLALLMSQDIWGNTLLHTIATNNLISIFKILFQFLKPILEIIEQNNDDENSKALQKLLQQFINSQDSDGDTPLHILIRLGNIELLTLFLLLEPNPLIENNDNKTAIDLIHELQSNTQLDSSQSTIDFSEISSKVEEYLLQVKEKFPNRIIHLPTSFHPSTNFARKMIAKKKMSNGYPGNDDIKNNYLLNDISLSKNNAFPTDKIDTYEKIIIQIPDNQSPHYNNINRFLNNDLEKDEKEPMIVVFQGRSAHGEQMMYRKFIQSKDDIHDLFSLVTTLHDQI